MELVPAFRQQARACAALGSPMYADVVDAVADDLAAGGPSTGLLAAWADAPGPSAVALRLMGSVHRQVLERRAGELATYYPSVGGTWDAAGGTRAFLRFLAERPDEIAAGMARVPQTNEVGRSAALVGGLLHLPAELRLPVRLFELGSSGGLLLQADRFGMVDDAGNRFGPADAPLVLEPAWTARPLPAWPGLAFATRDGCDPDPVDVGTTEGRLSLTAYVWADQVARLERLRAALAIAAEHPAPVQRRHADEFVAGIALERGASTVLWHSVMWQYLDAGEQRRVRERIDALGESATAAAPFVHLFLEPTRRTPEADHEFLVVLETWPGGVRRVLGVGAPHGLPVTWD